MIVLVWLMKWCLQGQWTRPTDTTLNTFLSLQFGVWSICVVYSWQRDTTSKLKLHLSLLPPSFTRTDELMRRPDVSVCVSLRFSLVLPFQAHHCFYISAMICSLKRIKSGYSSGIKGFNSVKVISMFPFNENKLRILFILMMNTSHNLQFSVVEISDF